jgi:hypothetical protein
VSESEGLTSVQGTDSPHSEGYLSYKVFDPRTCFWTCSDNARSRVQQMYFGIVRRTQYRHWELANLRLIHEDQHTQEQLTAILRARIIVNSRPRDLKTVYLSIESDGSKGKRSIDYSEEAYDAADPKDVTTDDDLEYKYVGILIDKDL